MFKEPAYWMYYFWSKNKRARKDKAVISNATWTMAILWLLNLMALHLLFEAWGWDMLTGWFSSLTDKVEWSRFNPVAYLFAAATLAPFIWIARKLYYRPAKLKAIGKSHQTDPQCLTILIPLNIPWQYSSYTYGKSSYPSPSLRFVKHK